MEVHILPKKDIHMVAEKAECMIVHSECIGGVDIAYSEEIIFIKNN